MDLNLERCVVLVKLILNELSDIDVLLVDISYRVLVLIPECYLIAVLFL